MEENSSFLGSLVVTLLFVPFSIYFGVVFLVFAIECYQFFSVWRLVSRTRFHGEGWDNWYRRFLLPAVINRDDDVRAKKHPHKEQTFKQCLEISSFCPQQVNNHTKAQSSCNNCPICLCDFQDNEKVATIRDCYCSSSGANLFHLECLTQWLKERASCPYCRVEVLPEKKQPSISSSSPLTDSLEMASLQVEHYLFNALALFGEFVASYSY